MTSAFHGRPPGRRRRVKTPDGVELEVREWGDPGGPELLLVTGVAQSYLSFVRQYSAPELQGFRIVAFDPRGHGLSDKPSGAEWYQEGPRWAGEVHAVMEALGLKRPVLAGWSMGGRIVRQYLVEHGDARLSGIVFISCRPVEVPEVVGPGNAVTATLDIEDAGSHVEVASAFLANCFGVKPSADEFAFALAFNMLCPWSVRRQIGGWLTDRRVSEEALRRITVPTLIVHGRRDVLVLPGAAEMSAGLIRHAEMSWYEGCGHSVFFEAPERFNRELAAFVGKVRHTKSREVAGGGAPIAQTG